MFYIVLEMLIVKGELSTTKVKLQWVRKKVAHLGQYQICNLKSTLDF